MFAKFAKDNANGSLVNLAIDRRFGVTGESHVKDVKLQVEKINVFTSPKFDEFKQQLLCNEPDCEWKPFVMEMKSLKRNFPTRRSRNYPFGDRVAEHSTRAELIENLPDPSLVEKLVDNYMDTFERTHRLFHRPTFEKQLKDFWLNPTAVSDSWLSALFMMLALSCHSCPVSMLAGIGKTRDCLVEVLVDAAELALVRTPFMFKPTLDILRSLCMMVLAKEINIISFKDEDNVWTLMGFIERLAMSMFVHMNPYKFLGMPTFEAEMRRRVWTTIMFLMMQIAIDSGMPLVIKHSDFDAGPPSNIDEDELQFVDNFRPGTSFPSVFEIGPMEPVIQARDLSEFTESSFQIRLVQTFPRVAAIVRRVNDISPNMEYTKVLGHDIEIRKLLRDLPRLFDNSGELGIGNGKPQWAKLQQIALEMLLRRALLTLHQPFDVDPQKWPRYQTSRWAILECSLALLNLQRELYGDGATPSPFEWVGELFGGHFRIAVIYVMLGLRRGDFSDTPDQFSQQPTHQTAWEAVRACADIFSRTITKSVSHYKMYTGLTAMMAVCQCVDAGEPSHINSALRSASSHVKMVVEQAFGVSTSTSSNTSEAQLHTPASNVVEESSRDMYPNTLLNENAFLIEPTVGNAQEFDGRLGNFPFDIDELLMDLF
ncbi:hypothetical protein M501DRAFT_1020182 [Patellaria atrata CBS 101060]|uniref:Xylanolytic transcriptional activator regulatory domain-containing protein n=1 Tax=Patellaria atrata CBS 101060 TaxID=1346257 RepID=A0A9P4S4W4_9PEZI|nr:hypothetical protein M501DRAFT_1020182 [Patellaria atrata CBS 101060]